MLDLSYRYGTDDWGIDSHTVEARYRLRLGGAAYIEPQLRWYKQGAADFYRLFLARIAHRPHVGRSTAGGLHREDGGNQAWACRWPTATRSRCASRVTSRIRKRRSSSLAGLSGLDLNPRLRAVVLQLDWRFGF